MFSQPSEIWDFRLRREVILPHLEAGGLANSYGKREDFLPLWLKWVWFWGKECWEGIDVFYRVWGRYAGYHPVLLSRL